MALARAVYQFHPHVARQIHQARRKRDAKIAAPLNAPDPSTFYASGEKGYTDYPFLESQPVAV